MFWSLIMLWYFINVEKESYRKDNIINYLIYSISFISFTIMFLVNSLSYLCLP